MEDSSLSWSDLFEALPDGTALLDEHGVMFYVNSVLTTLSGYSTSELVGQNVTMLVPARLKDREIAARSKDGRDENGRLIATDQDLSMLCRDGSELPVDFTLSPITFKGHSWAVASVRDNSATQALERARRDAEARAVEIEGLAALAMAKSEQRFRLAFEDNMAPMVFTSEKGLLFAVNDAFCDIVGRTREELLGFDSKVFTFPEDIGVTEEVYRRVTSGEIDRIRYVKRFQHKDGRTVAAEVSMSPARDENGETLYFVSSVRDITEERALTAQLSHQALHDPLTGLANRALFDDRLAQAHARVARQGGLGAVLIVDLDDFKTVNDTHGHLVGDQLLIAVSRRFEEVTRASDTICRFGGDEFLYLAEGLNSPEEAENVAARLLNTLVEPFSFAGAMIDQHASVGLAVWDKRSRSMTEVVQNADVALYESKRQGKGHVVAYGAGMRQQAAGRFTLTQELEQALAAKELSMNYQPIISLSTSDVVGFEALMRWEHPEQGQIPPNVFIPLAEESDLILDLGFFALHEAVAEASSWNGTGEKGGRPFVTVNLSAHQFHDLGLVPMIESALQSSGLDPERLVLEITESVTLHNVAETMSVMERLIHLGIGFALDDFGTGYSSLSYLALLRPRIIKIDQSFVSPASESIRNDTLLEAIVTLGNKLNMTMIAEGIETKAQLDRLLVLGCELGQGFYFSPAVPADDVAAMLAHAPWR
ncbi:MAG TPA: EAL domain-containing protein [Acidimicrobiales bacterium]|nr:EAL domain-containing protein [Acidimicrobiales bacterium]